MITLDYRVGGWVKKCQNIDYVILERSHKYIVDPIKIALHCTGWTDNKTVIAYLVRIEKNANYTERLRFIP